MSEELHAEIERLKAENGKLAKDLAGALDDLKDVRAEARDRRHENKTLTQQVAELMTDRDRFKAAAEADPENLRQALEDKQATIRVLKHERAFEKVAHLLKVTDPVKFADLQKVAVYTPEGDEPDESKITATFQEALKGRPWLVDAEPGGSTIVPGGANAAQPEIQPGGPGPGSDRGQSVSSTASLPAQKPAGRL
jgi:hypothetical protein